MSEGTVEMTASTGPMPDHVEQVKRCKETGLTPRFRLLVDVDDEELLELVEEEIRTLCSANGFEESSISIERVEVEKEEAEKSSPGGCFPTLLLLGLLVTLFLKVHEFW